MHVKYWMQPQIQRLKAVKIVTRIIYDVYFLIMYVAFIIFHNFINSQPDPTHHLTLTPIHLPPSEAETRRAMEPMVCRLNSWAEQKWMGGYGD